MTERDSDENVQHVDNRVDYYYADDATKCMLFALIING